MHEVSLCRSLAAAVGRAAGDRRVEAVEVTIGQLRQVVPDALTQAWTFVVRDTALDGAELRVTSIPAVITCDDCAATTELGPELGFDCRSCGSSRTRVTSGEEFTLTAIDICDPARATKGES
jgi:hydrogenase nickel incorporation protein HypA/HybF